MDGDIEDMALGESYEDCQGFTEVVPCANEGNHFSEIAALKAQISELASQLHQTSLENQKLTAQLSNYVSTNQKLKSAYTNCEAAKEKTKQVNQVLEQQVQGLEAFLRIHWSTEVEGLISQFRAEGAQFLQGQNGYNEGQPPMDLDAAKGLLVALQEFPIYINYCNKDLQYVWVGRTIKGKRASDCIGKRDDELLPLENEGVKEFFDMKVQALAEKQTQIAELTIDFPDAGRMSWMVTCKPHFNSNGEVVGVSTACIDITEKVEVRERLSRLHAEMIVGRATEGELRHAVQLTEEAIRAKNMFLAIMSHEIRTPLNGLLGMSEALAASELNLEQRELVSAMLSSGVIIADILGDILDLASMESGAMELEERPFSPADVVQDILKMALAATREKGIAVQAEVAGNVPNQVVSDALRIRQIMKYLVLNAIKFTQAGSVCIRLAVKEVPHTPVLTAGSAKDLKMKVRDEMEFSKATLEPMRRESSIVRKEIEMLQTSTSSSGSDLPRNPSPYIVGQKRTHSKSGRSIENIENEQLLKQSNVSMSTKLSSEGWQGGREGAGMDSRREKASAYFDHQSTQGVEKLDGDFIRNVVSMEGGNFLQPGKEALSRQSSASEKSLDSQKSQELRNCSESPKSSDDQILLWCEIVDTGVGIPKESFATLFDTFTQVDQSTTRNFGGTGLGLAICKQLVELMGGQLTVTSDVGRGSTFSFTVLCKAVTDGPSPLKGSPPSHNAESQAFALRDTASTSTSLRCPKERLGDTVLKSSVKKQPRILLAEDNKVNVMVAISMLKRLGFTAKVVANGVEALKAIQREKYDLVLLDICMPLMDGLQVAYAIRQYEETGQWPEGLLRNFLETASQSMNQEKKEGGGSEGSTKLKQVARERNLADALQGLTRNNLEGCRRLPIVAVTANALRSDVEQYFAHGMDAFIAKPVMFQNLRETLAKYLPMQGPASSDTPMDASPTKKVDG